MVRLEVIFVNSHYRFSFISIPCGAIRSYCANSAALYPTHISIPCGAIRSKAEPTLQYLSSISIPCGAIRRHFDKRYFTTPVISIPCGAIRSESNLQAFLMVSEFQFLVVRLEAVGIDDKKS